MFSKWAGIHKALWFTGLCVAALAPAAGAGQNSARDPETLRDPVAKLQQQLDGGELQLDFDSRRGYLDSLLEALDVPASSQTLVFSKTSLQSDLISPETPRALYFNDDVYVGWVQNGPVIEIGSVDPELGTIFYTLDQRESPAPQFAQEGMRCISCHLPARQGSPVPKLMVMSVLPSTSGRAVGTEVWLTTDESPLNRRWGGWYVTGTHGDAVHMGNIILGGGGDARADSGNLTDLGGRFDTSSYLNGHSDLVALTLLVHQSHIHNLIGEAAHITRTAIAEQESARRRLGAAAASNAATSDAATQRKIAEAAEPLVRGLLFSGAMPLASPIRGTSGFAEEFARNGIRDRNGRSLRDLDLDRRLLRYPLSYLIYSDAFDGLPQPARDYVFRRLWEVLDGADRSDAFAHLSGADRTAILEILLDTQPAFAGFAATLQATGP